jgi:hypothetical protein
LVACRPPAQVDTLAKSRPASVFEGNTNAPDT